MLRNRDGYGADGRRLYWKGGGGSGGGTTVQQNFSPEEAARRKQVMDEGLQIFGQQQKTPAAFPVMAPAGATANELAGRASVLGQIPGLQQMGQQGQVAWADMLGRAALDPSQDPTLQGAITASLQPLIQRRDVVTGNAERTAAAGAGQAGSSRAGVVQALNERDLQQQMANTSAQMAMAARGQNLDATTRALTLQPQVQQAMTTGGALQQQVGMQERDDFQRMLDWQTGANEWQINQPWANVERLANIVFGAGSSQSTATSTVQPTRGNPVMGAAGGAMMGYSVGGPWGAAAGATLGYLMT